MNYSYVHDFALCIQASVSADGSFFVHAIDFSGEKPAAPKAEPRKF
jgi:hypothetical protein